MNQITIYSIFTIIVSVAVALAMLTLAVTAPHPFLATVCYAIALFASLVFAIAGAILILVDSKRYNLRP